jgi:hypothetical protein
MASIDADGKKYPLRLDRGWVRVLIPPVCLPGPAHQVHQFDGTETEHRRHPRSRRQGLAAIVSVRGYRDCEG